MALVVCSDSRKSDTRKIYHACPRIYCNFGLVPVVAWTHLARGMLSRHADMCSMNWHLGPERAARFSMSWCADGLPNGMNGRQVAEAVRQHRRGCPCCLSTGYSGTTLGRGTEVARKPFDLDTLARRIQSLLSASVSAPDIKR